MECKLKKISINYDEIGEGRPILMLHSGYADHRHMKSCMEPLFKNRPGWKRIYFDYPGHGKTADEEWITSLEDVLNIVLEFIDKIIPDQNFTIASMSRGGYLSRGLLYHKSNLIDGLLMDVPSTIEAGSESRLPSYSTLKRDIGFETELKDEEAWIFNSIIVVHNRKVLNRVRKDFFPAFELADDTHHKKIIENFKFSFDIDSTPESFDKPVLILVGRQDSIVGYRDAWNIIDQFPRASFVVLDKAGHFLQVEQSQLFNVLANEWLDRVEEFGGVDYKRGIDYQKSLVVKTKD